MRKQKKKSIVILAFKTDVTPILGVLEEGKELTTPLTAILIPKLWNSHDGVRGVYPRSYKSLQDQRLKLNGGINRELRRHMEARLLASELLGKCGVFWFQLATEIKAFYLHLVTTTYVPTMVRVIRRVREYVTSIQANDDYIKPMTIPIFS